MASLLLLGLFCLPLLSGFLSLQNLDGILVGPGVEASHELLVHEALVNGWPEDLQSPAPGGGVQDGAQVLARELALPGQGFAVGFPDDGPAEKDKVSGSPQGAKDKCPREVETAAPPPGELQTAAPPLRSTSRQGARGGEGRTAGRLWSPPLH